ncbi:type IV pilus twitching motility protein PilT [bacterium]|nr:type IV pilus twitching motility protein PilT [candidate division CSSED10-310 bacterium]
MASVSMPNLLKIMIERQATDLHITTGTHPHLRVHGLMTPIKEVPPLTPKETKQLAYSVLTDTQKHAFEEQKELDFSFGVRGLSRFRANIYSQRSAVAIAIRTIPFRIMSFEELGLPRVVAEFCKRPKGLILITGPTGCGKSTTLAAIIDKINRDFHKHIVTIEDPIEYLHHHHSSVINQRELHADTHSFAAALKSVLRQDPDVILIGEMRDLETIEAALRCAETGHLTFATLHTNSAVQTINRIIDVFPAHQQPQIRAQLSFILEGVVCQMLIPRRDGQGRALAAEVMVPNDAIRNLIREDKIHQIYSTMQTGQSNFQMITMNQSLANLYFKRRVTLADAKGHSMKPQEFDQLVSKEVPTRRS